MAALLGCFTAFGVMHVVVVAVGILPAPSQALGRQTNWCERCGSPPFPVVAEDVSVSSCS